MALRRAARAAAVALALAAGRACAASLTSHAGNCAADGASCAAQGDHVLLQIGEQDRLRTSMAKAKRRTAAKRHRMASLAQRGHGRKSNRCENPTSGKCFEAATWAHDIGLKLHPDWYLGLDPSASLEDVQQLLHARGQAGCPAPCAEGEATAAPAATAPTAPSAAAGGARVKVRGRQILVDGKPLHIKGVCWSPVHRGDGNRPDYHYYVQQDEELMKAAGINAVRTYEADILFDREALDALQAAGVWLVPTVYSYGRHDAESVIARVNAAKDHPVVLMWAIGNEWNYNGIYVGLPHHEAMAKLNTVAAHIKRTDPSRPVATVYGGLPSADTVNAMPDIDVWGMNVYSGISFGGILERWATVSGKPLYLGEYGADAYNALRHGEDDAAQAEATKVLTTEIVGQSAADGGVCSGGFLFEFSDEWWKDGKGTVSVHDVGGIAPGGGPFPDLTFNEEWWGIVDVERKPRAAFYAYAAIENPSPQLP